MAKEYEKGTRGGREGEIVILGQDFEQYLIVSVGSNWTAELLPRHHAEELRKVRR